MIYVKEHYQGDPLVVLRALAFKLPFGYYASVGFWWYERLRYWWCDHPKYGMTLELKWGRR